MFCSACGTKNDDGAGFCSNCGKPLKPDAAQVIQPDQVPVFTRPVPTRDANALPDGIKGWSWGRSC